MDGMEKLRCKHALMVSSGFGFDTKQMSNLSVPYTVRTSRRDRAHSNTWAWDEVIRCNVTRNARRLQNGQRSIQALRVLLMQSSCAHKGLLVYVDFVVVPRQNLIATIDVLCKCVTFQFSLSRRSHPPQVYRCSTAVAERVLRLAKLGVLRRTRACEN